MTRWSGADPDDVAEMLCASLLLADLGASGVVEFSFTVDVDTANAELLLLAVTGIVEPPRERMVFRAMRIVQQLRETYFPDTPNPSIEEWARLAVLLADARLEWPA